MQPHGRGLKVLSFLEPRRGHVIRGILLCFAFLVTVQWTYLVGLKESASLRPASRQVLGPGLSPAKSPVDRAARITVEMLDRPGSGQAVLYVNGDEAATLGALRRVTITVEEGGVLSIANLEGEEPLVLRVAEVPPGLVEPQPNKVVKVVAGTVTLGRVKWWEGSVIDAGDGSHGRADQEP